MPSQADSNAQRARGIDAGLRALEQALRSRRSPALEAEIARIGIPLEPAVSIQGIRPFGWSRSFVVGNDRPGEANEIQRWIEDVFLEWNRSGGKLQLRVHWSEVWNDLRSSGFERDAGWITRERLHPQLESSPGLMAALERLIEHGFDATRKHR